MNDPALTTDVALLRLYAKGRDPEAFAELIKRHAGLVYGTCKRVLGNDDDAQDVSQECFLELARKAGSVRSSLPAYLHYMARNRSIDAIRKASARRITEQEAAMLTENSSERTWADIAPLVDEALSRLPDRLRVPIILHYLEGRTQGQIAQELRLSQSTVSRNLDKGVSSLREALKKAGVIVSVAALAGLLTENAATAAPVAVIASLGKMGVAGVGGAVTAAGVAGLWAALIGTAVGKCAVLAVLVACVATGITLSRATSPPHPARPYTLSSVLDGVNRSIAAIKDGTGKVVVVGSLVPQNGGRMEYEDSVDLTFRGRMFKAVSEQKTIASDGQSVEGGASEGSGLREVIRKTAASYDGKRAVKYDQGGSYAEIEKAKSERAIIEYAVMFPTFQACYNIVDLVQGRTIQQDVALKIAGSERVDGDDCVVLEASSHITYGGLTSLVRDRIWINPSKGYSVVRVQVREQGGVYTFNHLMSDIEVSLRNYGNGLWAPAQITFTEYRLNKEGQSYKDSERTIKYDPGFRINTGVTDADLLLRLPSGTKVNDKSLGTQYTVP